MCTLVGLFDSGLQYYGCNLFLSSDTVNTLSISGADVPDIPPVRRPTPRELAFGLRAVVDSVFVRGSVRSPPDNVQSEDGRSTVHRHAETVCWRYSLHTRSRFSSLSVSRPVATCSLNSSTASLSPRSIRVREAAIYSRRAFSRLVSPVPGRCGRFPRRPRRGRRNEADLLLPDRAISK